MKVLSSIIALLSASAAAAKDAQSLRGNSEDIALVAKELHGHAIKAAKAITFLRNDEDDEDYKCVDEALALGICLGEQAIMCMGGLLMELTEDDTCESLEADGFCDKLDECLKLIPEGGNCDDEDDALEACSKAAYPDEEYCDGLCESDDKASVFSVPAKDTSFDDAIKIKAAKAITFLRNDEDDEDYKCVDEALALGICLGEQAIMCMGGLLMELTEDDTCESLEADGFCDKLDECLKLIPEGGNCDDEDDALEACSMAAYPDEEYCDGLCESDDKAGLFAIA